MGNVVSIDSGYKLEVLGPFIPPNWEDLNGYTGDARYVGVYWDSDLSVIVANDGNTELVTDGVWTAMLYNSGFSASTCRKKHPTLEGNWFIVDLKDRLLFWGTKKSFDRIRRNEKGDSPLEAVGCRVEGLEAWQKFEKDSAKERVKAANWFDQQELQ